MIQQKCINGWTKDSGEYKLVQLYVDGRPEIWFGGLHKTLHHRILLEALEFHGIPVRYVEVKDGSKVAATEGERYRVVGMGKAIINRTDRIAQFYGDSFHYEMGIAREHLLEEVQDLPPEWTYIIT